MALRGVGEHLVHVDVRLQVASSMTTRLGNEWKSGQSVALQKPL